MALAKITSIFLIVFVVSSSCWDTDDLELFDLIEEINENFYEVFGIDQSASTSDIKKSYRRLSLVYHPDKNSAENAEEKFRQIVAIYEVLKDEKKRTRYNQILVEGLPDWRQTVFYYRKARKMGVFELGIVLSIIITIGQYFVAWAVYVEKRLVMEEILSSKKKKDKKKKKQTVATDGAPDDDELNSIPTPHVLDLWPFRLSVFVYYSVCNIPKTLQQWKEEKKRRQEEEKLKPLEVEEEIEEIVRKPKKRVLTELPEYSSEMYAKFSAPTDSKKNASATEQETKENTTYKKGEWSDEELVLLSKAVNKFPGGCHQRWEKIADVVGRPVDEVIAKTKITKGNYYMHLNMSVQNSNFNTKSASKTFSISDEIITQNSPELNCDMLDVDGNSDNQNIKKRHRPTKIIKTAERTLLISEENTTQKNSISTNKTKVAPNQKDNMPSSSGVNDVSGGSKKDWTQNQQTIFEWALKQYPKGTDLRWDKIAEHIPGMSKEDCITRFKELAELVSKRKKIDLQNGPTS